ncbi:hypothetical protein FRC18_005839 [Serendipita sp. 400]|nr:hypothetical protein FRC18_005839 [Serendipita sp. 400]
MNNPFDSDPTNARNRFPDINGAGMFASSASSPQPQTGYPMMGGAGDWPYQQQQQQQVFGGTPTTNGMNLQYGQPTGAGYMSPFGQTGSTGSPFGMTPSGFHPQQQQQQQQSPYGMGSSPFQGGNPGGSYSGQQFTSGIGGGGGAISPGFSGGVASGGAYTSSGYGSNIGGGGQPGGFSRFGSTPGGDMSAGGMYSNMPTSSYGFGGNSGMANGGRGAFGNPLLSQFDPLSPQSQAQQTVGGNQQSGSFQLGASTGSEIDPGPLVYHPRNLSNPGVQMVTGFNGQTTLHIPIRPHSYKPNDHPRSVITMHRQDLEQWDPYGWRQSLNALESLRLAWESFRDDVAKVTDIGCPPHENAITHKVSSLFRHRLVAICRPRQSRVGEG